MSNGLPPRADRCNTARSGWRDPDRYWISTSGQPSCSTRPSLQIRRRVVERPEAVGQLLRDQHHARSRRIATARTATRSPRAVRPRCGPAARPRRPGGFPTNGRGCRPSDRVTRRARRRRRRARPPTCRPARTAPRRGWRAVPVRITWCCSMTAANEPSHVRSKPMPWSDPSQTSRTRCNGSCTSMR